MADVISTGFGAARAPGRLQQMQRAINIAGAATSVALVIGIGIWGYRLAMRDVTGIPVVRALEGPMRMAPSEPGGEIASHVGLAVNAIAADASGAPPPDQLVLAPRPLELTDEDQPGAVVVVGQTASPETPVLVSLTREVAGPVLPVAPVEMPTETVAPVSDDPLAVDAALRDDAAALDAIDVPLTGIEAAVADAVAEPAPPGALTRSPRPLARPAGDRLALAATAEDMTGTLAATPAASVDPADIAAGTRLVQLGAYDDEAAASVEWDRLRAQFGELIAGKARVIQAAQSGGRRFVRLRAHGFADEGEARRFCSALLAENTACIPVSHR